MNDPISMTVGELGANVFLLGEQLLGGRFKKNATP
jgi:hypothetical protein